MPADAVRAILKEQSDWEKKRHKASSKENLHKRYTTPIHLDYLYFTNGLHTFRNLQKKAKQARYEREKSYGINSGLRKYYW